MGKQTTKIYPIYVIEGQDVYLRTQALRQVREELLGKDEGLGEIRYEGKTADIATVLDELRTPAFLAEWKVVVIEDADKFVSDNRELLEDYFNAPSASGVLVLVCDTWRKNTRLAKQADKIGKVISAQPIDRKSLITWVIGQAKAFGKEISFTTAGSLIALVGSETGRLAGELEKLALFAGQRNQITAADIEQLCGPTAEESVFQITDLIADGKTHEALEVLHRVLATDRSAEYTMVGAISYSLRKLLKARAMIDGGMPVPQVCSAVKMYGNWAERFMAQVKRFRTSQLQDLIHQLVRIDYNNKSGLGQPKFNLEKFIICASTRDKV